MRTAKGRHNYGRKYSKLTNVCKLERLKLFLEDVAGERWVRGSGLSCPVWRYCSKGESRSIIGSSIIGVWAISREMGLMRDRNVSYFLQFYGRGRAGQYMCKSRTTPRDWIKCTRPEHPAHGGVMLCTVQCRPASACARKSPARGCSKETRQDKISR